MRSFFTSLISSSLIVRVDENNIFGISSCIIAEEERDNDKETWVGALQDGGGPVGESGDGDGEDDKDGGGDQGGDGGDGGQPAYYIPHNRLPIRYQNKLQKLEDALVEKC